MNVRLPRLKNIYENEFWKDLLLGLLQCGLQKNGAFHSKGHLNQQYSDKWIVRDTDAPVSCPLHCPASTLMGLIFIMETSKNHVYSRPLNTEQEL